MNSVRVENWKGTIVSYPSAIVRPCNADDIAEIMKDKERYPSPVRAVGSNHSTTRCCVADNGTLVEMKGMDRIIEITDDTVTAEAGALYIDVGKELEKRGLQFFVNVEIGNLTIGSASCGGTKDASMPSEYGQVNSYVVGMKFVAASGELDEVTEEDPERLHIMRSSYGLLGVIYEVTFKVCALKAMAVQHETYTLNEFTEQLPVLQGRGKSMMLYLFPFSDRVTVEYRYYRKNVKSSRALVWKVRNYVWKNIGPGFSYLVTKLIAIKSVRYWFIDRFNQIVRLVLNTFLRGALTVPTAQMIRYPDKGGWTSYTFSIWAFPEECYPEAIRAYFQFCNDHYEKEGYRCNMLHVGYRVLKDDNSLFSYSSNGNVMTLDPVSTGDLGWDDFVEAYNEFCSRLGGVPLFNQTRGIKPRQAKKAFGERLDKFATIRRKADPGNRLLNEYFAQYF